MSELGANFGRLYADALESYFATRDEAARSRGYELGREALTEGIGLIEIADAHHAALAPLVAARDPGEHHALTQAAGEFLSELLSTFELSLRGYRAANEELHQLNESLQQQKLAIELSNQELESFSYSVSHDLRSPLRAIDGFSRFLLEDCGDNLGSTGLRYVQRIVEAARHMATLIEDLLALARVTRTAMRRVDVDLTASAQHIADELRAAMPDREVDLVIESGLRAIGDPTLLSMVLGNLLGNAWKYTSKRARAEIRFGGERRDGTAVYFVRDNGAGFDMAEATKLFAPFQRLHAAPEFEGTGIGLATVQRVVQRHGGRVWAEGERERGATFYFTLGGDAVMSPSLVTG